MHLFVASPSFLGEKEKLRVDINIEILRIFKHDDTITYFEKLNTSNLSIIEWEFMEGEIEQYEEKKQHVPKLQIKNQMWCLQLYNVSNYHAIFKLILCSLPPNISKIKICCKLKNGVESGPFHEISSIIK